MAVPWLRLIDAALGMGDVVRRVKGLGAEPPQTTAMGPSALGGLETRLAGVVVAALKEAFDRDHQRLELEREQLEAERRRAERALRLELLRQAGDRETSRMRAVAGAAGLGWLGSLVLASHLLQSSGARMPLGAGLVLFVAGMVASFAEQTRIARLIASPDERLSAGSLTVSGAAGSAAPWLTAAGFLAIAFGVVYF